MPNLKALHHLSLFLILSLLANSSQALEIAVHDMHGHDKVSMLAAAHGDPERLIVRFHDSHNADNDLPHPGAETSHPDESRFESTDHSAAGSADGLTVYPTDHPSGYSPESADDCLCAELCCMSLAGFSFAAAGHSHFPGISFDKRLPDHYQSISLDPLLPPPDH